MGSYESGKYNIEMSGYVDPSDHSNKAIKQMKDWFYLSHYPHNSSFWLQATVDLNFKVGNQNLMSTFYGPNYAQAQKFFFNLTRRHTNMICGRQRQNRKNTIALPIHEDDDSLADDFNKVLRYCENRDGFQEYFSEAFENAICLGRDWLHLYPDYSMDPVSGDLFTDAVGPFNMLCDSYSRKQDLSDCNGLWRRRWTSKEAAKLLLPGYSKEIDKMSPGGMKDGRFPVQAELQNVAMSQLFTFDEFYYRTTRPAKMIIDPHTGEATEWEQDDSDESDMMERTLAMQPWLIVKEQQVPTVKLCISLSDKIVYNGPNLLSIDEYPFVPMTCYHEPDMQSYPWRTMGVIRNIRDAQFLYNMRKVIELQILQSSVNAGWIFPIDAVTDIKAFRQSSGGDGFLVPLKAGHLPNEIQRIEPVPIPQSLIELSNNLAEDITKITGVNEELLGSATDDKSGILSMLRQGASLTTLQTIFDKADYSQRLYGNIRLKAIKKNFSKGKVAQILGHEADPRFFLSHSLKYSITVEEGNYSATQRQTELQQLLHFKELGMQIADKSILRAAFITDKKKVIQEMEEQTQQAQQQQQQQAQQQAKVDDAKIMNMQTKSQLDLAKVQESMAKSHELESMSEHHQMEADYALVKTAMELEDVQFEQIRKAFELAQAIKMANQPQEKQETLAAK
jgi:hypothetical protein